MPPVEDQASTDSLLTDRELFFFFGGHEYVTPANSASAGQRRAEPPEHQEGRGQTKEPPKRIKNPLTETS